MPCANLPKDKAEQSKTLATGKSAVQALSAQNLTPTVQLPALSATQAKSLPLTAQKGQPLQIGLGRAVAQTASPAALQALWQWQPTAAGGYVAALRFVSPQAFGVRLGVWVQALPPGAVLRVHDDARQEVIQITREALQEMARLNARDADATEQSSQTWWSPDFGGDHTTLEVEIPHGADPGQVRISVPQLSHYVVSPEQTDDLFQTKLGNIGRGDSCHVNTVCSPAADLESRATARMTYQKGSTGYVCSGTLLNDAKNSGTPWFLTADHCINSQTAASSLITYWFFRSSDCATNQFDTAGLVKRTGGAEFLYSTESPDVAFLKLRDKPPPGVAYSGSYFGTPLKINHALLGVHNPGGDLQKISNGALQGFVDCVPAQNDTYRCYDMPQAADDSRRFLSVKWQTGATQGGSSGSPLFAHLDNIPYVTGALSNGGNSCQNPTGSDNYGRFDLAFPKLKQWLKPAP